MSTPQVDMVGRKESIPKIFHALEEEDKDLTGFTIRNLVLSKN